MVRSWSLSGDVVDQKASIAELEAEKAEITVCWGQQMGGDQCALKSGHM